MDLERNVGGIINVGWTEPGEWISYTVQYPGNETAVQDVSVRCERLTVEPVEQCCLCPTVWQVVNSFSNTLFDAC